ncbi:MAG: hypothetical protein RSD27_10765 [Ruthenibacterium sp.]
MLNKVLSFLLRMMIVAFVLVCFAQGAAVLSGASSFLQAVLVISGSIALTYKMVQIECKRSALRVADQHKPIRVA